MKGHLCNWGEQCPLFTAWHRTMARRVRVFDNGGTTADRYTVCIRRTQKGATVRDIYTMSDDALSPQGVNMYSHTTADDTDYGIRKNGACGERVKVQDLPADVRTAIEHRLA